MRANRYACGTVVIEMNTELAFELRACLKVASACYPERSEESGTKELLEKLDLVLPKVN